jgi:hypothetical protein
VSPAIKRVRLTIFSEDFAMGAVDSSMFPRLCGPYQSEMSLRFSRSSCLCSSENLEYLSMTSRIVSSVSLRVSAMPRGTDVGK